MTVTLRHSLSMNAWTNVPWASGPMTGSIIRFAVPLSKYPRIRNGVVSWGVPKVGAEHLDAVWTRTGFRGAALLFPWSLAKAKGADPATGPRFELLAATDWDLRLNVVGRTRSGLLLADTPVALTRDFLDLEWWTNDARLVRLARETGVQSTVP